MTLKCRSSKNQTERNLIMSDLTAAQMGWKGWAHFNQPSKTAPRILKWSAWLKRPHRGQLEAIGLFSPTFCPYKNSRIARVFGRLNAIKDTIFF